MVAYYFWMTVLGVRAYMMIVDKNVTEFVNLFFMGVWIQLRKYYWMAILHPRNPITNWMMERRAKKMAKELMKEFGIEEE